LHHLSRKHYCQPCHLPDVQDVPEAGSGWTPILDIHGLSMPY
jgi:hypothetical protein